jgi:hypothetical protein
MKTIGSLVLVASLMAACTANTDQARVGDDALQSSPLLDVSDVSLLFPLDKVGAYPDLPLTTGGAKPLLSDADFEAILRTALLTGEGKAPTLDGPLSVGPGMSRRLIPLADQYAAWRIVSARFDTCAQANIVGADGKRPCLVQVRLIAQPLRDGRAQDASMHLVYTLGARDAGSPFPVVSAERIAQTARELADIRDTSAKLAGGDTRGKPLSVHPGLLAERIANTGKVVGGKVSALITRLTGEAIARNEALIAVRDNANNAPDFWVFFAGAIKPAATGPEYRLVRLPSYTKSPEYVQGFNILTQNHIPRTPDQPINTLKYLSSGRVGGDNRDFRDAYAIDDPSKTNFFNQDCASCHTATRQVMVLRRILGDGANLASLHVPAKGITAFVACKNLPGTGMTDCDNSTPAGRTRLEPQWNFRNFGYFQQKPTVTYRTANESEEVALDLNGRVFGRRAGPGADCSAVSSKVYQCLANLPGTSDPVASCIKPLCVAN